MCIADEVKSVPIAMEVVFSYLICVRCSYNDHRTSSGNLPRATRVHLPEEEIHQNRERPEDEVVQPPDQGWDIRFLRHLEI